MQERVHFVPPDVKIFQGKPPPTSWVEKNVVRFFQIRSEAEFLKGLLAFVQQLQTEQLSKKGPKGAQVKLSFAEVPEEGSPQKISNTLIFNATQPLVKAEIEHLEKLINFLKKEDPELAKLLDPELARLQKMGAAFPKLSEDDVNKLQELIEKLNSLAGKLPLPRQHKFWDKEIDMLKELINQSTEKIKGLKKGIDEVLQNIQGLKETQQTQSALTQLLGALKSQGQFSKHQVDQLISLLQNLATSYSKLTPKQQKTVNTFLKALASVKGTKGGNLASVASKGLLQQILKEYLAANPNASAAQIKQFLEDYLDKSGMQTTSAPFFKEMGKEIENLVKEEKGVVATKEAHEEFVADPKTIQVEEAHKATQQEIDIQISKNENFRAGIDDSHRTLTTTNERLNQGGVTTTANYYGSGGTPPPKGSNGEDLPTQFKNAIFKHFMPAEKEKLMELAAILFFNNMGAEIGNVLMDKVLDFRNAQGYYNLNSMLHKNSKGKYTGYSSFINYLNKEIQQAKLDLKKAKAAISYINKEIKAIKGKQNLTATQKNKLIGQLKTDKGNLEQTIKDIGVPNKSGLLLYLTGIKANIRPDTKNNTFTVAWSLTPSWQTGLQQYEGYVVNGHVNVKPPHFQGGLVHTQNLIQTDQQNFANEGQNNQMILQMEMTEIQQSYTVISTALQTLNQIYMVGYQAIYK